MTLKDWRSVLQSWRGANGHRVRRNGAETESEASDNRQKIRGQNGNLLKLGVTSALSLLRKTSYPVTDNWHPQVKGQIQQFSAIRCLVYTQFKVDLRPPLLSRCWWNAYSKRHTDSHPWVWMSSSYGETVMRLLIVAQSEPDLHHEHDM